MRKGRHEPGSRASALAAPEAGLSILTKSKICFFLAAGLSFVASVYLWFGGNREEGLFVGLWVPSILAAGALLLGEEGHRDE